MAGELSQTKHTHTNRLIHESSPYLLQHAHNPVDWYPWGDEAFEKARRESKPVLLSIGYSTCHWCHVMEHESFEDEEIARLLNEQYVPIKVDREQRPDVDAVYMSVVQLLTGAGGWPMTVWLTADRKPFYAGTYFPARDGQRGARVGFLTMLERLSEIYVKHPERVTEQATALLTDLSHHHSPFEKAELPDAQVLHRAFMTLQSNYDSQFGGFGFAPKFPRPVSLQFLFRYGHRSGNQEATEMALHSLRKMAYGGMYDQLGGGFHRYSVDREWLVPHFEKMLYDNAQLVITCLEALQISSDGEFKRIACETLDYVTREMTDAEGGFYSATDADSEGEEGKFFVWSKEEIQKILGQEKSAIFCEYYGVTEEGNFEGHNILNLSVSLSEFARKIRRSADEIEKTVNECKSALYNVRAKRIWPHVDDKILTAWNGLMIAAFARAAWQLDRDDYKQAAVRSAEFILTKLKRDGRLLRSYRKGIATVDAYLDDYAFLAQGLMELFEATGEVRWLREARWCMDTLLRDFWDSSQGGFFMTGPRHESLLVREKPYYDGAEPSGNSVAAHNLFRLASFTTETSYRVRGEDILRAFASPLRDHPEISPWMISALDYWMDEAKEIALVQGKEYEAASLMMATWRQTYCPNRVFVQVREENQSHQWKTDVPWVIGKPALQNQFTAYVCESFRCLAPTSDAKLFKEQIMKVKSIS